jgi:hypothetical protein
MVPAVTLTCPTCEEEVTSSDAKQARVTLARHLMDQHRVSQGVAASTAYSVFLEKEAPDGHAPRVTPRPIGGIEESSLGEGVPEPTGGRDTTNPHSKERNGMAKKTEKLWPCVDCKKTFTPTGNRQIRCADCGRAAKGGGARKGAGRKKATAASHRRIGLVKDLAATGSPSPLLEEIRKRMAARAALVAQIAALDDELAEVGRALKGVTPPAKLVK